MHPLHPPVTSSLGVNILLKWGIESCVRTYCRPITDCRGFQKLRLRFAVLEYRSQLTQLVQPALLGRQLLWHCCLAQSIQLSLQARQGTLVWGQPIASVVIWHSLRRQSGRVFECEWKPHSQYYLEFMAYYRDSAVCYRNSYSLLQGQHGLLQG
jgi:hypothetical protein